MAVNVSILSTRLIILFFNLYKKIKKCNFEVIILISTIDIKTQLS